MTLKNLRKEIDLIDNELLSLLQKRSGLAKKVGELKYKSGNNVIYVPKREIEIIDRLKEMNGDRFPPAALENIYGEIISACRSVEGKLRVAYLGPIGSFGNVASLQHFGSAVELIPIVPQSEIFTEVECHRADYGVVAVENSIRGSVRDVLEMFQQTNLKICAERSIDIKHNLLSNTKLTQIKRIYSHRQPFAQCRKWLRKNLPKAEQIEVTSTSTAAQLASREENSAAIGSELAGEHYGLQILSTTIMDEAENRTRFLVIGHEAVDPTERNRTSILFGVKHTVGALGNILNIFTRNQINLSKIESLPAKHKTWEYLFFVDFDGNAEDEKIQRTLEEIKNKSIFMKNLGSYPVVSSE